MKLVNLGIACKKNENLEHLIIPNENYENHKITKFKSRITKKIENLKMPCENYEYFYDFFDSHMKFYYFIDVRHSRVEL